MKYWFSFLIIFSFLSCSTSDQLTNSLELESFSNYNDDLKQLSKTSELVVIIPDIQVYTYYKENRGLLEGIVKRLLEIKNEGFQIKAVLQVGDITEKNRSEEWETAAGIFSLLDGEIEYFLCTGNHDYGDEGGCNNRESPFSEYFAYPEAIGNSLISTFKENEYENSYFQIEIQGHPFQIFSLEFGPRDEVVDWAAGVAAANKDQFGILLTHAYLDFDYQRYSYAKYGLTQSYTPYSWVKRYPRFADGGVNDGQELWEKLVAPNNIPFVVSGHRSGMGSQVSLNESGQEVLEILFAEHTLPKAIEGWIQILEFYEDRKTVGVKTYSALQNEWKTDSVHQYEFIYNHD